jgi:hypothetical protein
MEKKEKSAGKGTQSSAHKSEKSTPASKQNFIIHEKRGIKDSGSHSAGPKKQ